MSPALEVRPERPEEHAAIRAVHAAAFAPSEIEAPLLDALRAGGDIVEPLSLVALLDGVVVGHVAISRATIGGSTEALALGPIGVLPEHQGKGVGAALMRAVLTAAGATRYPLVALLGHAGYYPRFGFEPADALGVSCQFPAPSENWLAFRLPAYDPAVRGEFRYAAAFSDAG
jgi:putative acetyltransferase